MSASPRLSDPDRLLTVSAGPRYLWHSGDVGWQGALFTELVTAPAGVVDHAHEHYCLRRTHSTYRRRRSGRAPWEWVPIGWSLWLPGEEQRSEWEGRGRRQFLFVSTSRMEEALDGQLPRNGAEYWRQPEAGPMVLRLFDAMACDLATGSAAGPLVGDCLVTALCASLFGPPPVGTKKRELSRAAHRRVLDRIEHDLHRPLTLADLAAEAGVGIRQFCRAFRAISGTSPYQYVLTQRVERARRLIAGGKPLPEVALLCGFADQSQLTRFFTRHVGLPPAVYRRTMLR